MRAQKFLLLILITLGISLFTFLVFNHVQKHSSTKTKIPIVAIANYGPHSSLQESINGIQEELAHQGFIKDKTIHYEIMEVNFDTTLIPQMITRLKYFAPNVLVAITTPVAQFAKHSIKDIPVVYSVITDPVEAGLLRDSNTPENNITGSSDKQNLTLLLQFAKSILPHAKTIGLLYAPSEANDLALVNMMKEAAFKHNMEVLSIPIDHVRDMAIRMQAFKHKVDFIYVGSSGPIQPSLPGIAKSADKMGIPVFNVESNAVKSGLVLASFGVNYKEVGKNTGKLIAQVLQGKKVANLTPLYPKTKNHHGYIHLEKAKALGISLPKNLPQVNLVEN
jgi:putative ABC transport system substrate-binding protein